MSISTFPSKAHVLVSGPEAQDMLEILTKVVSGPPGSRQLQMDVPLFLQFEGFVAQIRAELVKGGIL